MFGKILNLFNTMSVCGQKGKLTMQFPVCQIPVFDQCYKLMWSSIIMTNGSFLAGSLTVVVYILNMEYCLKVNKYKSQFILRNDSCFVYRKHKMFLLKIQRGLMLYFIIYHEKTLEQKQIRDYWQLLVTALMI